MDDSFDVQRQDQNLMRSLLSGDPDALRGLMERYDRLIRFTVFRSCPQECRKDPTFLDGLASEVWTGFVESVRRGASKAIGPLKPYLIQIARNKCADHVRRVRNRPAESQTGDVSCSDNQEPTDVLADPAETLAEFEQVQALRECIAALPLSERNLFQEMELLSDSRWSEAAQRLEMPESTLRTRWAKAVNRVRVCVEKKLGK